MRCAGASSGIIRRARRLQLIVLASTHSMARRLKKLLVANRGEIALRIIRSARVFGLRTVAVYSAADANSAHVGAADEAIADRSGRGREELSQYRGDNRGCKTNRRRRDSSGLRISLRASRIRASCRRRCRSYFVGPRPDVMAALGDKVAARRIAVAAGVPVVPGIETAEISAARDFAALRSAIRSSSRLPPAAADAGCASSRKRRSSRPLWKRLRAKRLAAFGDGRIFIEKYLAHPRHVEIQILGDEHGTVVALGERDCSIQRRHQKIVEESPAPGLVRRDARENDRRGAETRARSATTPTRAPWNSWSRATTFTSSK